MKRNKILILLICFSLLFFLFCIRNPNIRYEKILIEDNFSIFELAIGEHMWVEADVTEGEKYYIYIVDSINNVYNANPVPEAEVITKLAYRVYGEGVSNIYDTSIYEVLVSDWGKTSPTTGAMATLTAKDSMLNIRVEGYDVDQDAGKYAIKILDEAGNAVDIEELVLGDPFATFELAEAESLWVKCPITQGDDYDVYIVDGYNNSVYGDLLPTAEVIDAVSFKVYDSDMETAYEDSIYTILDGGFGVTPSFEDDVATFTALSDEVYVKVQGYDPTYAGKFAIKIDVSQGDDDIPTADDFTIVSLTAGGSESITLDVVSGNDYKLYIVDSYNNSAFNELIPTNEVIYSVWFELYQQDGATEYPETVYTAVDGGGGVTIENSTTPVGIFQALDAQVVLNVEGYYASDEGKFAYALMEVTN